jgi:hypothetical protein
MAETTVNGNRLDGTVYRLIKLTKSEPTAAIMVDGMGTCVFMTSVGFRKGRLNTEKLTNTEALELSRALAVAADEESN